MPQIIPSEIPAKKTRLYSSYHISAVTGGSINPILINDDPKIKKIIPAKKPATAPVRTGLFIF